MLEKETNIKQALVTRFPALAETVTIQRERRIFVDVTQADFDNVFSHCVNNESAVILCAITGLDEGDTFGVLYHLACENGIMINVKTHIAKTDPKINTIGKIFPNADIYERELVDLLGIQVTGLAEGKRYPLPDGWPEGQYPLRKDFDASVLDNKGVK
jgi:membrane-bound hydrogenase subunit beta